MKTNGTKEIGSSSRNTKATSLFPSSNNLDEKKMEDERREKHIEELSKALQSMQKSIEVIESSTRESQELLLEF